MLFVVKLQLLRGHLVRLLRDAIDRVHKTVPRHAIELGAREPGPRRLIELLELRGVHHLAIRTAVANRVLAGLGEGMQGVQLLLLGRLRTVERAVFWRRIQVGELLLELRLRNFPLGKILFGPWRQLCGFSRRQRRLRMWFHHRWRRGRRGRRRR